MMKIAASTLTDQVADALIGRIQDGTYPIGSKLPSGRLLAEEFQVSPAVIRETTERLRTKGFVRTRQGAGCLVLTDTVNDGFQMVLADRIDKQSLGAVYELRYDIEGGAAALAAIRATEQDIQEMSRILDSLRDSLFLADQALAWDVAFHQALAVATHNPHYSQLLTYLTDQWRLSVQEARLHTLAIDHSARDTSIGEKTGEPGDAGEEQQVSLPERVHLEHVAVLQAVQARDPAAARAAAQAHMRNACVRLGLDITSFNR
jgi:GntR family transcriptional repressor for pyruvate dehydrogenase complex